MIGLRAAFEAEDFNCELAPTHQPKRHYPCTHKSKAMHEDTLKSLPQLWHSPSTQQQFTQGTLDKC